MTYKIKNFQLWHPANAKKIGLLMVILINPKYKISSLYYI